MVFLVFYYYHCNCYYYYYYYYYYCYYYCYQWWWWRWWWWLLLLLLLLLIVLFVWTLELDKLLIPLVATFPDFASTKFGGFKLWSPGQTSGGERSRRKGSSFCVLLDRSLAYHRNTPGQDFPTEFMTPWHHIHIYIYICLLKCFCRSWDNWISLAPGLFLFFHKRYVKFINGSRCLLLQTPEKSGCRAQIGGKHCELGMMMDDVHISSSMMYHLGFIHHPLLRSTYCADGCQYTQQSGIQCFVFPVSGNRLSFKFGAIKSRSHSDGLGMLSLPSTFFHMFRTCGSSWQIAGTEINSMMKQRTTDAEPMPVFFLP